MRILKLESENIKRLQAVEITPEGSVIGIGGDNAQGKSSVLDSIAYALGGKRAVCDKPVREGQDKAKIVAELDDLIVSRTFTQAGGGTLTVSNKDGAKFSSPQKILDKLTGKLTFDPLEFTKMEPKQQAETLKSLVGLDFTEQDQKRKELYDQRTQVNRDIKKARANLEAMPVHDDAPEQEISVSELATELQRRQEVNRQNQEKRAELQTLDGRITKGQEFVADIERQIQELQAKLQKAQQQLSGLEEKYTALQQEVEALEDLDEQNILDQMSNAEATNRKLQENKARTKAKSELKALEDEASNLSKAIEDIDQYKAKALQDAQFPVEGLSFDEAGVLLNGLPFSQASQAEQLKVSVAMGFAQNPELKVLLVRDGSLLDDNSMQLLTELAQKYDGQVWVERVGEDKNCAVIIEDGRIKNG